MTSQDSYIYEINGNPVTGNTFDNIRDDNYIQIIYANNETTSIFIVCFYVQYIVLIATIIGRVSRL